MQKNAIEEIARENYDKDGFFNHIEFKRDLRIIFIIKKMVNRFIKTGIVSDKLLVNNVIIVCNSFGVTKANILLRAILPDKHWAVVKSILIFLSSWNHTEDEVVPDRVMTDILVDSKNRSSITS